MHMPLANSKCVTLFNSLARRCKRGISDLRWARVVSLSAISFRLRIRSMTVVIRPSRIETKPETSNNRPVLTERARRSACRGWLVTAIDFRQAAGFVSRSLDQVGAVWAASQTIRCML